jgi:hypothetical protein
MKTVKVTMSLKLTYMFKTSFMKTLAVSGYLYPTVSPALGRWKPA